MADDSKSRIKQWLKPPQSGKHDFDMSAGLSERLTALMPGQLAYIVDPMGGEFVVMLREDFELLAARAGAQLGKVP